jgi:hypothetical protein
MKLLAVALLSALLMPARAALVEEQLFTAAPALWQPVVAGFLRRHGYPIEEDGGR